MAVVTYKWVPTINKKFCTGCGLCVQACAPASLQLVQETAELLYPDSCGSEERCISACESGAIEMKWIAMSGDDNAGRWMTKFEDSLFP